MSPGSDRNPVRPGVPVAQKMITPFSRFLLVTLDHVPVSGITASTPGGTFSAGKRLVRLFSTASIVPQPLDSSGQNHRTVHPKHRHQKAPILPVRTIVAQSAHRHRERVAGLQGGASLPCEMVCLTGC